MGQLNGIGIRRFLLVRLHMDDLMPLITKASLRRVLNNLPQGANKIDGDL